MEVSINQEEFKMETESMALEGNIIWKCNGSNLCGKINAN
jgi:hypothetical protein